MSASILPPTAPTTLVIMLGASAWPNSPGFRASQAFAHAKQGFRDYVLDPHGFGLTTANLLDQFDEPTSASDQLELLGSFLEERAQVLKTAKQVVRDVLVYFVGHGGFVGPSADFYLLHRRANTSSLRASGIAIDALAEVLREKARQMRRYLFLDCCFAAAAFRAFQGGPDQIAITKTLDAFAVQARSRGFPRKGTVLLCSSDQKSPSLLLPDESCTMFSYALLDVLRNGDLHRSLQLSLRDLKELAEDRLAALPEKNAPRPGLYSPDQSEGDVADVPFFPNPRAEEEQRRRAEQAEQTRLARQERMRQFEGERRRQAEIERQRVTSKETISPSLAEPGSAQSSNSAALGPLLPLTSAPFTPENQPRQEPPTRVVVASRITRRKIIVGLGLAGLTVAGSGIAWLAFSQGQHALVMFGQTPASTPRQTPNPRPLGTLLLTYTGHHGPVYAVTWSPDDTRIASGSDDGTVRVWDATTGRDLPFSPYQQHAQAIHAVAWSPGGKYIASGSEDTTVRVWDAAAVNTSSSAIYRGHTGAVRAIAWSPDGKYIASGSLDSKVRVWDIINLADLFPPYSEHDPYPYAINAVAWSPNGKRITSGGSDMTVRVWDATTGRDLPFSLYTKHTSAINTVAWSPNSQYIASGGNDETVRVWDATTGRDLPFSPYTQHASAVNTVAWSPDGKYIASGGEDTTVQVWNATDGTRLLTYGGHKKEVKAVAWSHNGRHIASAGSDGTVQIWTTGRG